MNGMKKEVFPLTDKNDKEDRIVDLHVHSIASDGSFTPAALAVHAEALGLAGFALTDHDTIAGCAEAREAAGARGLAFLQGMELTAEFIGHKIHIVCLGFDEKHPSFQTLYKKVRAIKEGRIEDIIAYIQKKGVDISVDKVKPFQHGPHIDRYAIMRYMVSLHLYDHAQPIWDNYLDPAARELGLDFSITAEEALPLVHEAGGVTSLAHFHKTIGLKGLSRAEQERAILRLHSWGLDGMERWYPNYSHEDSAFAGRMIEKYHLLPTAGTDFHGRNRPGIEMGTGMDGNMHIPFSFLENVRKRCAEYRQNG